MNPHQEEYLISQCFRGKAFLDYSNSKSEYLKNANIFKQILAEIPISINTKGFLSGGQDQIISDKLPIEIEKKNYIKFVDIESERPKRNFTSGWDHTLADYRTLLKVGIGGLIKLAEKSIITTKCS